MNDWLFQLPVISMAAVILAATVLVSVLIFYAVLALAQGDRARSFKSMSPVVLTPLAVVLALLVGFLSAQVWSDADRASAAVTREASALRTVLIAAAIVPPESGARIRELVRRHVRDAVEHDWPAMADNRIKMQMDTAWDTEALQLSLSVVPQNPTQVAAQRELVSAWRNALDARRERIIISRSVINWVKWSVVIVLAVLIQITIAIVHSDNRLTAAIAMAIFGVGVAASIVLLASHNRPFTGEISMPPDLLLQVIPEE
jgi:hypothetical protein